MERDKQYKTALAKAERGSSRITWSSSFRSDLDGDEVSLANGWPFERRARFSSAICTNVFPLGLESKSGVTYLMPVDGSV